MHFGSTSDPSKTAAAEAKPRYVYVLDFKTTQSEFQKASQTAPAEVRILNFRTTWSEFQVPSQTAPTKAKPRCVYSILKPNDQSSRCKVRLLLPR